jgi:hypothetical protein
MKLGCTISLKAAVLPGHQLTGPSEEEEEEEGWAKDLSAPLYNHIFKQHFSCCGKGVARQMSPFFRNLS